jgi:uncharacterized protein YciI
MHFVLFYEYTDDYLARRGEFRNAHLRKAWEAQARGELLLAGAFADPADGAALVFSCESASTPEQFAAADPYVLNGLVKRHWIRAWTTVVGKDASTPVRPT